MATCTFTHCALARASHPLAFSSTPRSTDNALGPRIWVQRQCRRCTSRTSPPPPPPPLVALQRGIASAGTSLRCREWSKQGSQPQRAAVAPLAAGASDDAGADPAGAVGGDFDWQLGLALAGCAFEAYNDVEAPSLQMTSMGGTQVTFVDQ